MIELAAFLGNPGREYTGSRHNFALALLGAAPELSGLSWKKKHSGLIADLSVPGGICRILQPHTYMNQSGKSVASAAGFFRVKPENILVVHDDLELPFGEFAWRIGGGLAGHRGLKSIRDHLGTADFLRLRLGIGRPAHGSVHSWVLGRFTADEEAVLPRILEAAAAGLLAALNIFDPVHVITKPIRVYP